MTRILRLVLSNIATLILSFILALVVWAVAIRASDPIVTKSLQLEVESRGILPAEGQVIVEDQQVQITLEGPQSILNPITPDKIEAFIDLSDVPFGESLTDIFIDELDPSVTVVFQDPQQTVLNVEQIISREIPVRVVVRGGAARGHTIGTPTSDPENIVVTGPATRVNQLFEAQVNVFLEDVREDFVSLRRPVYYDNASRVVGISGLSTSGEEIRVAIPVNEIAGLADKPIIVDWEGSPAIGYRLLDVQVEPASMLVTGLPTVLDELQSIRTELIDISGLDESTTLRVTLDLPENIELDEVEPVFITFEIEPILTTSVIQRVPEVRALTEGYTATLDAQEITVFLFGPLPALESIQQEDVSVTLDLFDLLPGTYNLEPLVNLSVSEVEVRSIQPQFVTVIIEEPIVETPVPEDELDGTATPDPNSDPNEGDQSAPVQPTPTPTPTSEYP